MLLKERMSQKMTYEYKIIKSYLYKYSNILLLDNFYNHSVLYIH